MREQYKFKIMNCKSPEIIKSLSRYVKFIEENYSKSRKCLFRGQRDGDELLPKLLRKDSAIDPSPLFEKDMFRDFKRRGRPFLKIEPQSEYEWLALAQHHGMITRLLDWTSSSLAALWFTVSSRRKIKNDGIVWMLRLDERDIQYPKKDDQPFDIKKTEIFYPTHIEPRFTAQGGWFTIHFYSKGIIPFNDEQNFKNKLRSVVIKKDSFDEIRRSLNKCGVNRLSLFPDFGGLCEHINWLKSK